MRCLEGKHEVDSCLLPLISSGHVSMLEKPGPFHQRGQEEQLELQEGVAGKA